MIIKKSFGNVNFFYEETYNSNGVLDKFFEVFIEHSSKINTFFDNSIKKIPIYIVNKSGLENFAKSRSQQYKEMQVPKWLKGFTTSTEIHILLPDFENLNEMVKVSLHEIVHYYIYNMNLEQPPLKVLDEGLAEYLSQNNNKKAFNIIIKNFLENNLKKLSDFCIYDSLKFANSKGYQYSYYITEFLFLNYGKEQYIMWLKNPRIFEKELPKLDNKFEIYIIKKIRIVLNEHN